MAVTAGFLAACGRAPEAASVNAAGAVSEAQAPSPYSGDFWKTWGDGLAELSGYDLTYPKYGQLRKGVAVTIFVTETFSNTLRVKSDPGRRSPADEFPVMKSNLIRDYQTGVYDYNDMVSTFVALAPVNQRRAGLPTKISFSSQEWCGHVYSQLLFGAGRVHATTHSYFDGEADSQRTIETETGVSAEDAFLHWARGMARPFMKAGQRASMLAVTSLETARAKHIALGVSYATLKVAPKPETIRVPAGTFETEVRTIVTQDRIERKYNIERSAPYRIIRWETSAGERAELLGSDRMKYWELNKEGGEKALHRLGLTRRGFRMP